MEPLLRISGLLGYPILGFVMYIAFAAGRMAQRVSAVERRIERIEDRVSNLPFTV